MKNIKSLSLIVTLLAFTFICSALNRADLYAANFSPKIVFEEHHNDFGIVEDNVVLNCKFRFRNDGNSKLIISFAGIPGVTDDYFSSKIEVDKKEYEPGETGDVLVTISTKNLTGEQDIPIILETNDPDNQNYTLLLHFQVNK